MHDVVFEPEENSTNNKHNGIITNSKVLIALSQGLIKISLSKCFASII